ncbi:glutathione S-transferase family protein [Noviherbaspirillum cavernae]|uniref:Glutathione S-transferase family protein n=1 Tax=Noviherbaspirillum cavernae TaxID=2320862 RepID=A0A418WWY2_9BURK|nr:glutathione S-transferase family protein [Noviherbaspirillum cavernae]RJG04748.1 glutathione S-transferase family protein [Noviherbaspirillum cavernae]
MVKVYGDIQSGNCYKIKLLMSLLGIAHEWIHVDILNKETKADTFLAMNPNAKIPVLEIERGTHLWESNAILNYLAEGTVFLPDDRLQRARVLQWQFFEQYSHEPYVAVARFIAKYLGLPEARRAEFLSKQEGGHKALRVMETQLRQTPYLTGDQYTIADVSLYAYTHVADEGGFDLSLYPAISRWLARIADQPRHVTIAQLTA